MDRSWIDGRFGKPVVMAAVVVTAALIALAVITADHGKGEPFADGRPSSSTQTPRRSSPTTTPSGRTKTTPTTKPRSPGPSNPSDGGSRSSNDRATTTTTPPWTADLPKGRTYDKTAQDADRAHLEDTPLRPENLPSDGHAWQLPDQGRIAAPASGDVASVPYAGRNLITQRCSLAPDIDRVTTQSEVYESDTGFALSDMVLATKSSSDARSLYRAITAEEGVDCIADAAADAVADTWGSDIDRIRITDLDIDLAGTDESVRYAVVAYDEGGQRRVVEFTTTAIVTGRVVIVVITAAETRVPASVIEQVAKARTAALTA
jgi:hypothetical protein